MTLKETLTHCCTPETPVVITFHDGLFRYEGTAGRYLRHYRTAPCMDVEVETYGPETSDDPMYISEKKAEKKK